MKMFKSKLACRFEVRMSLEVVRAGERRAIGIESGGLK